MRADFVSGATNGTWSISWSDPWPHRNWGARPPSTIIGELFLCADAIALMPLVTPGPAVRARDAGLPRDLRPALGRERSRGLVAHVDQVDALLATAVIDGEEVAAREGEELGHAMRLQAPGDRATRRGVLLLAPAELPVPASGPVLPSPPPRSTAANTSVQDVERIGRRGWCSRAARAAGWEFRRRRSSWAAFRSPSARSGRCAPRGSRSPWSPRRETRCRRSMHRFGSRHARSATRSPASSRRCERAGGRAVLVCACDMPFVTAELVAHLAARAGTAVPEAGGRLHPLLARYEPAAAAAPRGCAGRARVAPRSVRAGRRRDRPGDRDRSLRRPRATAVQREHARRPGAGGRAARTPARSCSWRPGGGARSGSCGTPGPTAAR